MNRLRLRGLHFTENSPPAPGNPPPTPPAEPPANPPAEPAAPPAPDNEKRFTQADMDLAVTKRLNEEKEREKRRSEEAKRKADEEAAAKAGEWKTVADQRQAELDRVTAKKDAEIARLNAEIAKRDREALQAKAGLKAKIPDTFWPRLQGETYEEMLKDAEGIAKHLAPPTPPGGMNPGNPPAGSNGTKGYTEQEQRANTIAYKTSF